MGEGDDDRSERNPGAKDKCRKQNMDICHGNWHGQDREVMSSS